MDKDDEEQSDVSLHAGFPNPASDKDLAALDLHQLLIHNPTSTFLFRLRGQMWEQLGIFDGDIAVVDHALTARQSDLVIWWGSDVDEFAISRRKDVTHGATIWGVVTAIIHQFR